MEREILLLDFVGTFAFACYGSYFAIKKNFDFFGILACAFFTALGGGTVREMLLNNLPFYLFDNRYIYIVLIGVFFTILIFKRFEKIKKLFIFLDSIGLIVFSYIGYNAAIEAGLGLLGVLLFSVTTAVGGGIIRDVVMNETPEIMHSNFYATIAILTGLCLWLIKDLPHSFITINITLLLMLIIRLVAVKRNIRLWKPYKLLKS